MKLIEQDPILEDLEKHIDRLSVSVVLEAIATICEGKAEHIRENWQDIRLAESWERISKDVEKASDKIADIEHFSGISA